MLLAEFPLTVLRSTVKLPEVLSMPPPSPTDPTVAFPVIVLSMTVKLPERFAMPPPYDWTVDEPTLLPLIVQAETDKVSLLRIAPPSPATSPPVSVRPLIATVLSPEEFPSSTL